MIMLNKAENMYAIKNLSNQLQIIIKNNEIFFGHLYFPYTTYEYVKIILLFVMIRL